MLFLSRQESHDWSKLAAEIVSGRRAPFDVGGTIRSKLVPCFRAYAGALLLARGEEALGKRWIEAGVLEESQEFMFNAFLNSFLERQGGRLVMPDQPFADPRPFMHFASVPRLKGGREEFVRQAGDSLPRFDRPLRIIDIGCGDGALVAALLRHLREIGRADDVGEVLLIDPSPAMIDLAVRTVGGAVSPSFVRGVRSSIQDFAVALDARYDIALSSFAYHHMPYETKLFHLRKLAPWIDHFVLFELDGNNDTPETHTPELALSIYQLYGRVIDWVFAHDAPVELAIACVDRFLMAEAVTMLTRPRGVRTDYHMLRWQWHDIFREGLGPEFTCLCDSTALSEEYIDLFTIHYGRA